MLLKLSTNPIKVQYLSLSKYLYSINILNNPELYFALLPGWLSCILYETLQVTVARQNNLRGLKISILIHKRFSKKNIIHSYKIFVPNAIWVEFQEILGHN